MNQPLVRLWILSATLLPVAMNWPAPTYPAQQATEGSYVGVETCGSCHTPQLAKQSSTGHARSLRPAAEHHLRQSFKPEGPLTRKPNYVFRFNMDAEGFRVKVSEGDESLEIPIEWAFGSGAQAVTFVSQLSDDSYLEHHFTYYSASDALAATPGHEGREPKALQEAAGLLYKTFDPEPKIMRCFRCHSTGPLTLDAKLGIRPAEPGVRCEACHGAGRLHVAAAKSGEVLEARKLIHSPGRLSAAALNEFCGNCHRKPAPAGSTTNWNDPWNTRHQPLFLSESACFQKSRGALSCLRCHDPHEPLRKNEASHYNRRCAECHRAPVHRSAEPGRTKDCISCHMPRMAPKRDLQFTNHWIGIYPKGDRLRPLRR